MSVLVEGAAEVVTSAYVEVGELLRIGDRWGQGAQWSGACDALVGPVGVVVLLELAQGVEQMVLVPDQGGVQQFVPAGLYPAYSPTRLLSGL